MTTDIVAVPESPLFGSADPRLVVRTAREYAAALTDVIRERGLVMHIGESDHLRIEGWTFLGAMTGVFAPVEWTRPLFDGDGQLIGYEARAEARNAAGRILGTGDGMCTRDEYAWSRRPPYALRSMAQTRAVSQALRRSLGYIVELAGYNATPAEEMPTDDHPAPPVRPVRSRRGQPSERELREAIGAATTAKGISPADLERLATSVGVRGGRATRSQLQLILDRVLLSDRVPIVDDDADLPDIGEVIDDTEGARNDDDATARDEATDDGAGS